MVECANGGAGVAYLARSTGMIAQASRPMQQQTQLNAMAACDVASEGLVFAMEPRSGSCGLRAAERLGKVGWPGSGADPRSTAGQC